MKTWVFVLLLALAATLPACCGDIVTVPTANQLKAGQVDLAYYYIGLDTPSPQPEYLQAQTLYVGLTDKIELDVHRYDPQKSLDVTSTIFNATYLLVPETASMPNVVVGGRNLSGEQTTLNPLLESRKRSWFVSAAKNVTPMTPQGPKLPLVRLHASLGTRDETILEKRHEGLFGGIQSLLTPEIGAVALWDGQDMITGLTYTPGKSQVTIKAGGYGKHWWAGVSYLKLL